MCLAEENGPHRRYRGDGIQHSQGSPAQYRYVNEICTNTTRRPVRLDEPEPELMHMEQLCVRYKASIDRKVLRERNTKKDDFFVVFAFFTSHRNAATAIQIP